MILSRQSNRTRMPIHRLRALADEISGACPTAIVVASDYLAKHAELAARSGVANDSQRLRDEMVQIKKMLA